MTTNNYPGVGKKTRGKDFNFFRKFSITATTFGGDSVSGEQPDIILTFPTQGLMLLNENSSGIVEYSFNGNTVHGELNPSLPSKGLTFDGRRSSTIWFRVQAGSSGPIVIRLDAW